MERVIAELFDAFTDSSIERLDEAFQYALGRICSCLKLDMASLWQVVDEISTSLTLTHHYPSHPDPPIPTLMLAEECLPWCHAQLLRGELIVISSVDQLASDAARDQAMWRQCGVRASLLIPLSVGGGPIVGALSFSATEEDGYEWPDELIRRLQIVARLFATALARRAQTVCCGKLRND